MKEEEESSSSPSQDQSSASAADDAPSTCVSPASSPPSPKPKVQKTPPVVEEILQEEEYYKILGLTQQQARNHPSAIKKAYRKRCVQTHPDKTGGDRRAFDKVAEAYEVLSDDSKRQIYDRFGKRGLQQQDGAAGGHHFSGFAHAEDLFRSFFGHRGANSNNNPFYQAFRRNRTVRYQLEVTLEDLYQGMKRTVLVAPPDGSHATTTTTTSNKRVQVDIPRGALHGQSIVLPGEMDFDESDTPGDLIFLLKQRPHTVFTRKGHDLAMTVRISLQEAICGVTRTIQHLNGRPIVIGSARQRQRQHYNKNNGTDNDDDDDVDDPVLIQTGDVHVLKGQGMPKDAQGMSYGDLYVQYQVEMPKTVKSSSHCLTSEERQELGRLLDKLEGKRKTTSMTTPATKDDSKIQYLQKASLSDFGRASGKPHYFSRAAQDTDPTTMEDNDDDDLASGFSPFGGGGRRGFFYSSSGTAPFFGMGPDDAFDEDDGNVQCRQM